MNKCDMLRITLEEKQRFEFLKRSCDSCIPDELIEWIHEVEKLVKEKYNEVK